jgi:hypothetical protein
MSDHEFEKQVRQKLDDLRLMPSANAWENIEEGLRERKRRALPFFWLPLLMIGLAAGGYWIVNRQSSIVNKEKAEGRGQKELVRGERPEVREESKGQRANGKEEGKGQRANGKEEGKGQRANGNEIVKSETSLTSLNYYSRFPNITSSGLIKPLSFDLPVDHKLQTTPLITKIKDPVSKIKKWSFGVSAFAGLSTVNKGNFLNFSEPQVEDVTLRAAFAAQAFAPSYTPSSIYPSVSYSIGVTAKRNLSKRFSLSTGINYLQMNTHNKVGKPVYGNNLGPGVTNSIYPFVFNYFTIEPERPKDYNNRYHFIEVPVTLHTKLNHSQKLPVYWNAGVAVSQLIASHSLHFDESRGIYYKNNNLLNQTQLALTTGFSFSIFNKKRYPLLIGPSAKYNLSNILKKDMSSHNNFMSLGLDFKIFLK